MNKDGIKIGVLISGRGSNLNSIIDAIDSGMISGKIAVVISNKADAGGLHIAREHKIPAHIVLNKEFPGRKAFDAELVKILHGAGVELVVMAGFMRIVTGVLLKAFPMRVMNIHPALLPCFPGDNGHGDALSYGVKFSGCTVHFVDEGVDTGPIIIQAVVPVFDNDTEETLAGRILEQEHRIYPRAIQLYSQKRLIIEGRKVKTVPMSHPDTFHAVNPLLDV